MNIQHKPLKLALLFFLTVCSLYSPLVEAKRTKATKVTTEVTEPTGDTQSGPEVSNVFKVRPKFIAIEKLAPFITLAYNYPLLLGSYDSQLDPYLENQYNHGLSNDLMQFQNWRLGLGLRLNQYIAFEAFYSSFSKNYMSPEGNFDSTGNTAATTGSLYGNFVNTSVNFYTPAIDLKYVNMEFGLRVGAAFLINGVENSYNSVVINEGLEVLSGSFDDPTLEYGSSIPQFISGISLSISYKKIISARTFVDFITLSEYPADIGGTMLVGVALDLYLL